ncbi:hypothetical protein KPH14_003876 [Odynerus spinipes]|uniref:Uncharacterized protein n=1 Tax=Odynerus spinipes TaxID=1348599 RepID=A0AAD9RY66_9HYME|nr:hypothetical protein KPH14_003876 [Odynerus spinipes]
MQTEAGLPLVQLLGRVVTLMLDKTNRPSPRRGSQTSSFGERERKKSREWRDSLSIGTKKKIIAKGGDGPSQGSFLFRRGPRKRKKLEKQENKIQSGRTVAKVKRMSRRWWRS